ncbi:MAG TPA: hypothetical protein VGH84_02740 [Steroidobacteraceae bacterium]|jgi:hypothetical protein
MPARKRKKTERQAETQDWLVLNAAMMLLMASVDYDANRVLAMLGTMVETALEELEDKDIGHARALLFLDTLAEKFGIDDEEPKTADGGGATSPAQH